MRVPFRSVDQASPQTVSPGLGTLTAAAWKRGGRSVDGGEAQMRESTAVPISSRE